MPEFIAKGIVKMCGADFIIFAKDLAEARQKAIDGNYEECETSSAEIVDCKIDADSIETNE